MPTFNCEVNYDTQLQHCHHLFLGIIGLEISRAFAAFIVFVQNRSKFSSEQIDDNVLTVSAATVYPSAAEMVDFCRV